MHSNYRYTCTLIFLTVGLLLADRSSLAQANYRVVIMTDMTHDDGNSLIRYLYYAHQFDTEAIIITPQLPDYRHHDREPWRKGQRILEAYRQEYPQLARQQAGFPTYDELLRVTKPGRGALPIIWLTDEKTFSGPIGDRYVESSWGDIRFSDWIGEGTNPHGEPKDSEGSEFLQTVFEKDDDRPIFVQLWGGPITFVQALYRYRQRKGEPAFRQLLDKLHLYGILLQDITFDYLIDLDQVKALDCTRFGTTQSTYRGDRVHPRWLLHDGGHFWNYCCRGDPDFAKPITAEEVQGHGPMSALYDNGGEGDTPSFLYLLSASLGLNDPREPTQGSWGGRFVAMGDQFPAGYYHTCGLDEQELMRWKEVVNNSFLNRLNYSVREPSAVNHEPVAVVNQDTTREVLRLTDTGGRMIRLDASGSYDPDQDSLSYRWWVYPEAGTYPDPVSVEGASQPTVEVAVPSDLAQQEIHLILEVRDEASPPLVAYRRIILTN